MASGTAFAHHQGHQFRAKEISMAQTHLKGRKVSDSQAFWFIAMHDFWFIVQMHNGRELFHFARPQLVSI